jgi:WD40 repeat protein
MVVWELGTGAVLEHMPRSEVFALRRNRSIPGQKPHSLPTSQVFALSSAGRDFAVGTDYGEVDLWNLETGDWEGFVIGPSGMASSVLFMPDGRLVALFNQLDLAIYQTNTGPRTDLLVQKRQMRNPGSEVLETHSLAASADGQRLAIGGIRAGARRGVLDRSAIIHDVPRDGEVQVWDVATGKKLTSFNGSAGEVFGVVALDRGGKRVAGVSGIQFASILTGTLQRTVGPPTSPTVTPAVRPGPLKVSVWDIAEK